MGVNRITLAGGGDNARLTPRFVHILAIPPWHQTPMEMTARDTRIQADRWCPWVLGLLPVAAILFDGVMRTDQNANLWFMPIPVIAALLGVLIFGLATQALSLGGTAFAAGQARMLGFGALCLWGLAFGLTALQAVSPVYGFMKLAELAVFAGLALALTGFLLRNEAAFGTTLVLIFAGGIAVSVPISALARWADWPGGYGPLDMPGFIHIRIYAFSLVASFIASVTLWPSVSNTIRGGLMVAMVLCATALFWSGGRAGFLALGVGLPMLALLLPRLRGAMIPALAALVIGALAATLFEAPSGEFGMASRLADAAAGGSADALTSGRLAMWTTLATALADVPILGRGYGQAHWIFGAAGYDVAHLHAHNIVLDLGLGLGVPGLLVAAGLVLTAWVKAVLIARQSDSVLPAVGLGLVTVFLIVALLDGAYFYAQGLLPLSIGSALLLAEATRVQRRSEPSLPKRS